MNKIAVSLCFLVGIVSVLGAACVSTGQKLPGEEIDASGIVAGIKGACTSQKKNCSYSVSSTTPPTQTDPRTSIISCSATGPSSGCTGGDNKTCKADSESPYECIDVYHPCCTPSNTWQTVPPSVQNPFGGCDGNGPAPEGMYGTRFSC